MIRFGFTSDWLGKWREFFKLITKRRNIKPKQTRITYDTQVKIAPLSLLRNHLPITPSNPKENIAEPRKMKWRWRCWRKMKNSEERVQKEASLSSLPVGKSQKQTTPNK